MSFKDKQRDRISYSRKKSSRRPTSTDWSKSPDEDGNDDIQRFPYFLKTNCEARLYESLPKIISYIAKDDGVLVQVDHPLTTDNNTEGPQQLTILTYCNNEMKMKQIICHCSNIIDTRLFYALQRTLSYFPTLDCLKLDYCNLSREHIFILQKHLQTNRTLTELSLTGNPIREQNFHLLVPCGLKVLVLKFCKINEQGLEKLAKEFFNCSHNTSTLIHLDLASNMVFDNGCTYIASILKCDRTLQSLNLTDCNIRDDGFKVLMGCFVKFPLDSNEIGLRRKIRLGYFKALHKGVFESVRQRDDSAEAVTHDFAALEDLMKKHTFTDAAFEENGDVWCKGNHTLASLNIAYNHLTESSMNLLVKTIMEQSAIFGNDKGLQSVGLEGNAPYWNAAKSTIQNLLESKKLGLKTSSLSITKEPHIKRRKSSAERSRLSGADEDGE